MGAGEVWSNGDIKSKGKSGSQILGDRGPCGVAERSEGSAGKKDGKMWRQRKEGVR